MILKNVFPECMYPHNVHDFLSPVDVSKISLPPLPVKCDRTSLFSHWL
jgi:hypothetical protein